MAKKVLMITLRSDASGGPRHVFDLVRELRRLDVDVDVASPLDPPYGPIFQRESQAFFELPHRGFSLRAFLGLRRFVARGGYDIVHSHGRGAGLYSRLLKPFISARVIHTFHGVNPDRSWKERMKRFLDRFLAGWTDWFISVSASEMHLAQKFRLYHSGYISLVMNGINLSEFTRQNETSHSDGLFHVGLIARPDPVKGLDLFLADVAANASEYRKAGVVFELAGVREGEMAIPPAVGDLIRVRGFVNSAAFLSELDLFCSFSRSEGLPLTVLEAQAMEIPCLLSDIPGHQYFHATARFFDPARARHFLEQVLFLKGDRAYRERLTEKARKVIAEEHGADVMAQRTLRVY